MIPSEKEVLLIRLLGLIDKTFLELDPTIGDYLNKINSKVNARQSVKEHFLLKCLNTEYSSFVDNTIEPTATVENFDNLDLADDSTQSADMFNYVGRKFYDNNFLLDFTTEKVFEESEYFTEDDIELDTELVLVKKDDPENSTVSMFTFDAAFDNQESVDTEDLSQSNDIYSFHLIIKNNVKYFL